MTLFLDPDTTSTTLISHLETSCPGCSECLTDRPREREGRYRLVRANRIARDVRDRMRHHPKVCTYCGDIADHEDHLLPETWTGIGTRHAVLTVPACADCNTRIGDYPEPDIDKRCAIVAESVKRKHARLLSRPPLGSLAGVTGKLRVSMLALRHQRATVVARLSVLAAGGFLELKEHTRDRITYHGIADLATEQHDEAA